MTGDGAVIAALIGAVGTLAGAIGAGARWLMRQVEHLDESRTQERAEFLGELRRQRSEFNEVLQRREDACEDRLREIAAAFEERVTKLTTRDNGLER